MSKLMPLHNLILVAPEEREKETQSGLYIPDSCNDQSQAQFGIILEISADILQTQELTKELSKAHRFQVGDKIAFKKYAGVEFNLTDPVTRRETKLLILKRDEVLAAVVD